MPCADRKGSPEKTKQHKIREPGISLEQFDWEKSCEVMKASWIRGWFLTDQVLRDQVEIAVSLNCFDQDPVYGRVAHESLLEPIAIGNDQDDSRNDGQCETAGKQQDG